MAIQYILDMENTRTMRGDTRTFVAFFCAAVLTQARPYRESDVTGSCLRAGPVVLRP